MRWRRVLAWSAGGIAAVLVLLFASFQTSVGQRTVANLATSLASSPDSRVEISGLEGFFPTDLRVDRVTIADGQGIWLRADKAKLRWSFASLFTGRVRIGDLSAARLEILRPPAAPANTSNAPSSSGGMGLPLGLDLQSVEIPDIHIGPELAAGVDSHWKLAGSVLLAAAGTPSHLKIALDRTDGPAGHVTSDLAFDLGTLSANGHVALEEPGKGGIVAALAGRPDLDQVSAKLVARGDRDNGSAELMASAQDVLSASGLAHWRTSNGNRSVTFDLGAQSHALGGARVSTSGIYDVTADKLDATAAFDMASAEPVRDRLGGADWHNLHLDLKTALRGLKAQPSGSATIAGSADDVAYAQLLGPVHVDLAAKLGLLRDGRISVDSLDLASPLAHIKGTGSYRPTTQAGDATLSIDGSNLAAFSALAGMPLEGRTHVDLTLNTSRDGVGVSWRGTVDDLSVPGLPPPLAQQNLRLSGKGRYKSDGDWQLDGAKVDSDRATFDASGHGAARAGELALSVALPDLAQLQPGLTGSGTVKASLAYSADEAHGKVNAEGTVADQSLGLSADFTRRADGSLLAPSIQGHWASATIDVHDLTVTPQGTTGSGHLAMTKLEDLKPVLGADLAGALDVDIATEPDPAGKLRIAVHGTRLRGEGVGAANLQLDATVVDPLGKAETDATMKIAGMSGVEGLGQVNATVKGNRENMGVDLNATGQGASAALSAKLETASDEARLTIERLAGKYRGIPIALAAPAKITAAGPRTSIAPASLAIGSGRVTIAGALDSANSDLTIQIAQLPFALLEAFAPGTKVDGIVQAKLHVTGALAAPRIQATYAANGLRLRKEQTALIPALALQGSASLTGQQATFDASVAAGSASRLSLKGEATLPQGRAALRAKVAVRGNLDMAPFAAALGNSLRNVSGTVRPDLVLTVNGETMSGTGTISIANVALTLPDTGLRLSNGQGTIALQGETMQLQRLSFQTARNGEITATGTVRLDKDMPVQLAVSARKALVANRPDLAATVSSDIRVTGSVANGLDVSGPVTIDRAEIGIGVSQAANYPVLAVREINGTSPNNGLTLPSAAASSKPGPARDGIRLALQVRAPQAIFVRGRGLNAEVGGQFTVAGDPSHPSVLGSLTLRRGTFSLAGHTLDFTRGNVSLVSATTIDPLLDFAATTTVESTTIEIDITGTSRAPKIALTSSPELPQDEAMAMLLFGKPSASLTPSEILMAAQAVSELTGGTPVASGFFGRLRRSLGLDQLGVGSSSSASSSSSSGSSSDLGGTALQGGRYVAPGVYVGAEQGTTTTSTRGVVEIEVLKHTKIEGAVGADSNDKVGAKMEWDY